MLVEYPEDALEPSHPARVLWDVLGKIDLKAFSKGCESVEGAAGRSLKSPRMLLALWLYALAQAAMGGPRTIVGVNVANVGSDLGSMAPMVEQIEARTGQRPTALLADGGHVKSTDISATRRMGVDVLVPPPETAKPVEKLKAEGADAEVIAWRERMRTDEAKQIYRARAGLVEFANAHQKTHHGITQVLVRGTAKVTCAILLSAIGSNLLQHTSRLLG